jgi:hypothetical protein
MKNVAVVRAIQRLDDLFAKVAKVDETEMKAHWSRYLCVLVSGLLEKAFVELITDFATNQASPNVANYVSKSLSQFQNAKMGKMLAIIGQFNVAWKEEIEKATEGDLADAVDSVVANRHKIAHGESVGISYAVISDYYKRILKYLDLIEARFI